VHKILNLLGETHPFPVLRLVELKKWVDSGEYATVLGGGYATGGSFATPFAAHYTERGEEQGETVFDNIKSAANKYKDDFVHSQDPMIEKLSDAAEVATEAASVVADKAKKAFEAFVNKPRA
jgi:hypothetical protein